VCGGYLTSAIERVIEPVAMARENTPTFKSHRLSHSRNRVLTENIAWSIGAVKLVSQSFQNFPVLFKIWIFKVRP
jgi:hypothetical protein